MQQVTDSKGGVRRYHTYISRLKRCCLFVQICCPVYVSWYHSADLLFAASWRLLGFLLDSSCQLSPRHLRFRICLETNTLYTRAVPCLRLDQQTWPIGLGASAFAPVY